MTNATAPMPALRGMTDGELTALYDAGDAETRAAVLAWCDRQDRQARVAPARDALARLHAEWYDAAYADFLAAEAACAGYFVRPEYAGDIEEPFRLWSGGNDEWAHARACDELRDWWLKHPRLTFDRWMKRRAQASRIAREEAAETTDWQVPAEWEAATDGHDSERAEVDGPPQAGHGRGSAASAVRPGRDGQQHGRADAGRMRDARPVQRTGGNVTGDCRHPKRIGTPAQCSDCPAARMRPAATPVPAPATYTPGNYAAAIVTGGTRKIIRENGIPALEQAQGLLEATYEARELEAIGQPLEWRPGKRPGTWQAGNTACVFVVAEVQPQGGTVAKRDAGTVEKTAAPIPGDQLLDLIRQWLGTYIRFPSAAAQDVVTLWAAHAHCRDESGKLVFRATPRLFLLSSEPGSGKSAVLELLNMLCPEAYGLTLEPTGPGLVKSMRNHETVCIDESDVLFGRGNRKEQVRSILNGGYTRNGTYLTGHGREDVFGPVALAGLDVLEKQTGETLKALLSRGFRIRMVKASKDDRPAKITRVTEGQAAQLKMWLAAWAAQERDGLAEAQPVMPEELDTRAEQISEPLVAVADAAGGDWPERARQACVELALAAVTVTEEDEDPADAFAGFAAAFGESLASGTVLADEGVTVDGDVDASWVFSAPAPRQAATRDAAAAGCRHAGSKFGTARQCGDCPAAGL